MSDLNDVRNVVLTIYNYESNDLTDYNNDVDAVIAQFLIDQNQTYSIQEFREHNYKDLRKWIYPDLILFFQFMAVLEYIETNNDFVNQYMFIMIFFMEFMEFANLIQIISENFPPTYS